MKEVKRRNPEQYIRNASKTYCLTQGKQDYAFHDTAKSNKITTHDNTYSPTRNQYPHLVLPAPKMSQ